LFYFVNKIILKISLSKFSLGKRAISFPIYFVFEKHKNFREFGRGYNISHSLDNKTNVE